MSQTIAYLEAVIGADISNYRRQMSLVRNDLGFMADRIDGLGKVGQRLSFAVTLPLALAAGAIVKTSADFQAAMYNVASISDDVANNFDTLSAKVLEFGANTRSGAQAAAEALYEIYSVGYRGDAFELMTVSVQTAEAGLADLATTTRALANALNAYASDNLSAVDASNVLTRTVQVGAGTLEEYATNLGRVAPVAAALGISFDELGANWAFITQQGAGVGTAATELSGIMNKLLKPSTDLAAVFEDLGVSGGIELIDKFGGLNGALKVLYDTAGSNPEVFAQLFGDARAIRGILKMTNSIEDWDAALAVFYDGLDTATMSAWEQQSLSMSASFDRLVSAVQGVAIYVGQQLIPVIQPVVDGFRELVLSAMDLDPALIQVAATFAAVVAAAGPVLWLVSSLVSPIGILIGAIAALGVAVATNFANIRTTVENALNAVFGDVSGLSGGLQTIIDAIFNTGGADGSAIQGPVQQWVDANQVEVGASTFITVKPGDTLWGIWQENFADTFNWEDFKSLVGLENPNLIHPGDIIEIPAGASAEMRDMVQGGFDFENAFKIDPADWNKDTYRPISKDLGTRLKEAFEQAWPDIRDGLISIVERASQWITGTAVPWLAGKLGELVGSIGRGIGQALGGVGKWLQGKEGGNILRELWDYFGTYVWEPFVSGLESQLGDLDVGNAIVTTIVGLIGTALAGKALVGLLTKGIGGALSGALSAAIGGLGLGGLFKTAAKGATSIGGRIIASIATSINQAALSATGVGIIQLALEGLMAAAAAGLTVAAVVAVLAVAFDPEVRQQVRNAIDDLMSGVFGEEDFSNRFSSWFQVGLSNGLAGIFDLVGRSDVADNLRTSAEAVANQWASSAEEALSNSGPITPTMPTIIFDQPQMDTMAQWHLADPARAEVWRAEFRDNVNYAIINGWQDAVTTSAPQVTTAGQNVVTNFSTGLTNGVTTNAANIQWSADAMVSPIADTVTTNMSEGGPILTAVNGFVTTYSDQMSTIGTATQGLSEPVSTGLGELLNSIITFAGSIITRVLNIADAFRQMVDAASGAANIAMPTQVGASASGRAIGGPVIGATPYMVGEYGPELFVPNVSGTIVPTATAQRTNRNNMSSAQPVTNNFYIYGVRDVDGFVRETNRRGWKQ